ncbi:MAG: 4Fe-4S binding protein [Methanotrichaceae archaeon]|nr:4Fe-4S binding protein [Methanotrichaceae archaeon]
MTHRKIIKIDESLCTGCGNCIVACAEDAIELIDGKARVVSDRFCDGLGACIGECPVGALTIEEREAEEFDEKAAKRRLDSSKIGKVTKEQQELHTISPCSASFSRKSDSGSRGRMRKLGPKSQLCSWPIQMRLAHIDAPYFNGAKLLIAADCSGFASGSISDLIKNRVVLIGCPKLDDTKEFVEKLEEILKANDIKDIAVLHMEVPCCTNLVKLVSEAIKRSGKKIPLERYVCGIDGCIMKSNMQSA